MRLILYFIVGLLLVIAIGALRDAGSLTDFMPVGAGVSDSQVPEAANEQPSEASEAETPSKSKGQANPRQDLVSDVPVPSFEEVFPGERLRDEGPDGANIPSPAGSADEVIQNYLDALTYLEKETDGTR